MQQQKYHAATLQAHPAIRSYDQFIFKVGSLSRLMQLAMSVVYDLQLNRTWSKNLNNLHALGARLCSDDSQGVTSNHSLEERRAVLGCFVFSGLCVPDRFHLASHANIVQHLILFLADRCLAVDALDGRASQNCWSQQR